MSFLTILQHFSLIISYFWQQATRIRIKWFTTQMVMIFSNKGAFFSYFGLYFNNFIFCFSSEFTLYKLISSSISQFTREFFLVQLGSNSALRLTKYTDISKRVTPCLTLHNERQGLESVAIAKRNHFLLLFLVLDP